MSGQQRVRKWVKIDGNAFGKVGVIVGDHSHGEVEGGFKMTIVVGGVDLDSQPQCRWLVKAKSGSIDGGCGNEK